MTMGLWPFFVVVLLSFQGVAALSTAEVDPATGEVTLEEDVAGGAIEPSALPEEDDDDDDAAATAPPPDESESESESALAAVRALELEMAAVEELIAAHRRQVEVLGSLRELAMRGVQLNATCESVARLRASLGCEEQPQQQQQQQGKKQKKRPSESLDFDDVARELFEVKVPAATAVDVLTIRVRGATPSRSRQSRFAPRSTEVANLVAVGFANGTFVLLDALGRVAANGSVPSAPVKFLVDGGLDDVAIAVACEEQGGEMHFFDLALFEDGRQTAGRRFVSSSQKHSGNNNNNNKGRAQGGGGGGGSTKKEENNVGARFFGTRAFLRPLQKPVVLSSRVVGTDDGDRATAFGLLTRRSPSSPSFDPRNETHVAKYLAKSYVVVGRRNGVVDLVHRLDGTVLKSLPLEEQGSGDSSDSSSEERGVSAITKSGVSVIVAHGKTVSYVSPRDWVRTVSCVGEKTVAGFALDGASSSYLHVAYVDGEVLLFRAKMNSGEDRGGCRVLHQVQPPSTSGGAAGVVATGRGFVATAAFGEKNSLHVHNTTFLGSRTPPRLVATLLLDHHQQQQQQQQQEERKNHPLFALAASSLASSASESLFASLAGDESLRVYESLAKYEPPQRDVGWMRMPILFVGIVVVFGYQLLQKKQGPPAFPRSSSSRRGGGGGGGLKSNPADFERLVKHLESSQGGSPFGRGGGPDDPLSD